MFSVLGNQAHGLQQRVCKAVHSRLHQVRGLKGRTISAVYIYCHEHMALQ